MIAYQQSQADQLEASVVLGKAVIRAADRLALSHALLGRILGVSPPTITRLYSGKYRLDQRRKEWEL